MKIDLGQMFSFSHARSACKTQQVPHGLKRWYFYHFEQIQGVIGPREVHVHNWKFRSSTRVYLCIIPMENEKGRPSIWKQIIRNKKDEVKSKFSTVFLLFSFTQTSPFSTFLHFSIPSIPKEWQSFDYKGYLIFSKNSGIDFLIS